MNFVKFTQIIENRRLLTTEEYFWSFRHFFCFTRH